MSNKKKSNEDMYREVKESPADSKPKTRKRFIIISILVAVAVVLIVLMTGFRIETIQVTGNIHYTEDEIREIVTNKGYINNSILLYIKNKFDPIEDVPFVDKMDIEFISNHVITVTIYEKSLAGCVEYMNEYIYFDKDGIVLETSSKKMDDIPCITGMSFEKMELYSKLPIDDDSRFKKILNLTQLIQKYGILIDGVRFNSDEEIILYHSDIKIQLGKGDNLEEQMRDLNSILAGIEGKKGTLNMKDFSSEKGNATFKSE